jgi:putative DNA primase/helicase
MIDAADIDRARAVPIQSLVAGWKLRRAGAELVGPCPMCGLGNDRLQINTRKNVFFCRACNPKGGGPIDFTMWLHRVDSRGAIDVLIGARLNGNWQIPNSVQEPVAEQDDQERLALARRLWKQSRLAYDAAAEDYLRARGYVGRIPHTIRYLAPNGDYPPSMIAAFGLALEVEPGVIDISDDAVRGVHITRLLPDGSDRERGDMAKIIVGRGFNAPITLAPPNDLLGMAVTEGIEDGLAVLAATGLGVWVAGNAGRMPGLADLIPPYIEAVTIYGHADPAGEKGARELADRLLDRDGLDVFIEGIP